MHAQFLHILFFQDSHLEFVRLSQFSGLFCQISRGTDIAGQIAQILGQFDAVRDCAGLMHRGLCGAARLFCTAQQDFAQCRLVGWFALELVATIGGFGGEQHDLVDLPGFIAPPDGKVGEI